MKYRFKPETKEKAATGGGGVKAGVYEMRVTGCELTENSNKNPQWEVTMAVEKALSEGASPAGSTHTDWITWTEAAEWRAWVFFQGCGVDPEKLGDFDLASTELVVGRTVRVTVVDHTYTTKDGQERKTTKVDARGYAPIGEAGSSPATPTTTKPKNAAEAVKSGPDIDYGDLPF